MPPAPRPPTNRWAAAIAVMLSAVMEVLDTSVADAAWLSRRGRRLVEFAARHRHVVVHAADRVDAMGVSFVTTELARRSQLHQARIAEHVTAYGGALQSELGRAGEALGRTLTPDSATGMAMIYGQVQRQASAMSFLDLFHVLGLLFLAVVPIVWFMRRPHRRGGAAAH